MTLRSVLGDRGLLVEAFAAANLAFLVVDVYVAHSVNEFGHAAEWIPLGFAGLAALLLAANLLAAFRDEARTFAEGWGRSVGLLVGWGAILVGVAGLGLHLESSFFRELTIRSLVYSAPFVAPLAFAGLGFLVLLNRMVRPGSGEWTRWVLVLALGGFVGNFLLALVDHAQNGFFHATEWIPVGAAALAVGALAVPVAFRVTPGFVRLLVLVLALQVVVGVTGFGLHLAPLAAPSSAPWADRIVFGPPPFAPLLFADLAILGLLGAVQLRDVARGA